MPRLCPIIVAAALCGCSGLSNPWAYDKPPGEGAADGAGPARPAMVIAPISEAPNVDARFTGVGDAMQTTLARMLRKTGRFDVVTDSGWVAEVEDAMRVPADVRRDMLDSVLRGLEADSGYLLQARITDYLHTSDAPAGARRLSWFSEANDAIVAMDVEARDLRTGRVVLSEQYVATRPAGDPGDDAYGTLEFGSYLFWSTPLGGATRSVLDDASEQIASLQVATPGAITVSGWESGTRQVELSGEGSAALRGGETTWLVRGVDHQAVLDDLGRPLRVRIERGFFGGVRGWLLSQPSEDARVIGATLSLTQPTQRRISSFD